MEEKSPRSERERANLISELPQVVEKKVRKALRVVVWDQLPEWQQDNHFIRSGYRPASGSYLGSFQSLGYLHNESVNVYSHLIGAILALATAFSLFSAVGKRYPSADADDLLVLSCYFIGAVACLGLSATYHLISNHSEVVAKFGNKLDYLGIVALIWGSFVPTVYYGFRDDVQLMKVYWTMITTIGAGCAVVSINSEFRKPKWRPFRAAMFVGMGLSAIFPVLHGLRLYGVRRLDETMGLSWVVLQGFLYVLGAGIYAVRNIPIRMRTDDLTSVQLRVPERWRPGQFDIWGSSHQIFHIMVLCAAAAHLMGLLRAFDHRHSLGLNADAASILWIPSPMPLRSANS
ncbi:HlyIII-domain-containing protein [Viridothelium virens]|uniref:HlyIII-domain-containing protein n=1 Tax=Viridothelium virens TaxID=1048519 RepID=A0A6A6HCB8_VIRVR|nr:HlyIII-domain-containing protein [Viridothelium virens]